MEIRKDIKRYSVEKTSMRWALGALAVNVVIKEYIITALVVIFCALGESWVGIIKVPMF